MNKIRLASLTGFMILAFYLGLRHQIVGGGPSGAPPIDAYCPFGGLETLPYYLTTGSFLQKTAPSNFWLLVAVIVTTLLAGAVFCGWICPLGGLADWLYKLRLTVSNRKVLITPQVASILSYGRYLMLAGIVYFSWLLKKLWFEEYDPYKTIFHMSVEGTTGWLIIALFVAASLLIERSWCRFLCPLGAFNGLLSRFALFDIERASSCIHCGKCDRNCPAKIMVSEKNRLQDSRCIKCMQCVDVCPVSALSVKAKITGLPKLKPLTAGLLGIILFLGIIGAAQVSGQWSAKSPSYRIAAQITDPNEIKGWMKWTEVAAAFGVDEKQLLAELGIPENIDRSRTVKNIRGEFGISETKFRQAVAKLRTK